MSEREPSDEQLPDDLDPRDEAAEVRGGTGPLQSSVQQKHEETGKSIANNLRD